MTALSPRDAPPGRTLAVLLALLMLAALIRAPFSSTLGEDEVFFALGGLKWLQGLPPYAHSFDVKPPGLFALFAVALATTQDSLLAIKALPALFVGLTACGLYLIGVRHLSARAGLWAAVCCPMYGLALSGTQAPTDLMLSAFETFAMLTVLEAMRSSRRAGRWLALCGLLFGLGFTVKQTAVFPAIAAMAVFLLRPGTPRLRAAALFGATFAVPGLAFLALFHAQGALGPLIAGAFLGALGRTAGDGVSFAEGLWRFLPSMKPLVLLLPGVVFLLTRGQQLRDGPMAPATRLLIAWIAADCVAVIAMRAMYPHYLLPLIAPLLLAFWTALFHLLKIRWGARGRWVAAVITVALAVPVAIDLRRNPSNHDAEAIAKTAARIDRLGLAPEDRLLVVNRGLALYLSTHRLPSGPYFHPQHLLCDFPARDADPLASALAQRPRALVVADTRWRMFCEREDRHAALQAVIRRDYCHVARISGRAEGFDLYLLRANESACAADLE